jgi:hypothetical protein
MNKCGGLVVLLGTIVLASPSLTAWDILPTSNGKEPMPSDFLPLVKIKSCAVDR